MCPEIVYRTFIAIHKNARVFPTSSRNGTRVPRSLSISINSVIADSFVNEIFGNNMITLTPDDVKKRKAQTPDTRLLCRNVGREIIEAPGAVGQPGD